MLCLVLSGAFSYAHGVTRTGNVKGTPIVTIAKTHHGGIDKSHSIDASFLLRPIKVWMGCVVNI